VDVAGSLIGLFFLTAAALPFLLALVSGFARHRHKGVRCVAKALATLLLWFGFNVSLFAIWGAVRLHLEWWAALIGVPALQIPAAYWSFRVVFGSDGPTDGGS
jgi:hypothetical protein